MPDPALDDATRQDFIEKVGMITQSEGLPRIAGRIMGLLVFDGKDVSFGDLAADLQVSRGSISTSVRLLEERGIINRVTKPGQRQDYFQLAPDPYPTMLERVQRRVRKAKCEITETMDCLQNRPDVAARLAAFAAFYNSLEGGLTAAEKAYRTQEQTETAQSASSPKDIDQ